MKIATGLQCQFSVVFVCQLFLCLCLSHSVQVANAKSLEHHSHHPTKDLEYGGATDVHSCDSVAHYFNSLNITVRPDTNGKTGTLCGGRCCGNESEEELTIKSTNNFYRMLRHHTRSLRNTLESTAQTFRDHVVELTIQSENKTLNLFSQVYRRMSPLSRQPILEFYREIRNFFNSRTESNLDEVVTQFFRKLFPVAYHHAVHSGSDSVKGDFHVDYKNCLMHTFEDLQPFGSIPKVVAGNLIQSIGAATVFMTALDRGADILESAEEINSDYLTSKCRNHLTKMHYCAGCNGISKHKTKTCYGYCTNVMRLPTETSFSLPDDHVVELTIQSENKTLNLFSQVYRRMSPLSRQPILEFYREIRNFFNSRTESNLDEVVTQFFRKLFPVAYHHAVHSGSDSVKGDFHVDYKNCLMHTFEDLQPFGSIPKVVAGNLIQSIGAATVFMTALDRGADILESAEEINSDYLTSKCRNHLTKMHYCAGCNGISKHKTKTCYGYCTNVMRGCLAQYVGVLDNPWSNVAEPIEMLYHSSVKTDKGIEEVIKTLDVKLSEAIMHAMENGPELEKKVKKSCGTPSLLPNENIIADEDLQVITTIQSKWMSPPNTEMLKFLVIINKSKDFYAKIVDSVCEDEELKQDDRHCWTGDRIGDYTQTVMTNGVDAQRYNPEVPLEQNAYAKTNKLNELVDKLIKLRHTITNAMTPSKQIYDIQSDMARHDEEGSGGYRDEEDDYEDHNIGGSGDGSGYGAIEQSVPRLNTVDGETTTGSSSASTQHRISICSVTISIVTLATLIFTL